MALCAEKEKAVLVPKRDKHGFLVEKESRF